MLGKYSLAGLWLAAAVLNAQPGARVEVGTLQTGAAVAFVQSAADGWGVEIAGAAAPRIAQRRPARLEIFRSQDEIRELAAGYKTVRKTAAGVDARAEIADGRVLFRIDDQWTLTGAVVSVRRTVAVEGSEPGGFNSSLIFTVDPAVGWSDVRFMAPGLLYGDSTYDGERSPGGTRNDAARRFLFREDLLPAPLFALSFGNGASVAMLDPAPRGNTTEEDTTLAKPALTDVRFQFGSLGARQNADGDIEFGFTFPGNVSSYRGGPGAPAKEEWIRRYHPITSGVDHHYQLSLRFAQDESFRDLTRNAWRWAWTTLNPAVTYIDVEQMRRVLTDHLEAQAATIDGRTAIPFVLSTMTDKHQWNWTMAAMGFVGKNLECADQLLREGDRDPSERGQKMRQTGLAIIASMIQALPTAPLQGIGYNLATGKPWGPPEPSDHDWLAPWLRNATEDMRVLMRAYRRESALGRQHPEWLAWVKSYTDWLIQQQREDGSFPRRWKPGSNEVAEAVGTASYAPVPLLVLMTEETGDPKYRQSAIRAAEYVWSNWGTRGLFIGGASDNPNITDKEAGMLSMEAYISLYESTKDARWLERAKAAANFAESWIWIWNLPMPEDADDAQAALEEGRTHGRVARHYRAGGGRRGRISRLGRSLLCQALQADRRQPLS